MQVCPLGAIKRSSQFAWDLWAAGKTNSTQVISENFVGSLIHDCCICKLKCHKLQMSQHSLWPGMRVHLEKRSRHLRPKGKRRDPKDNIMITASKEKTQDYLRNYKNLLIELGEVNVCGQRKYPFWTTRYIWTKGRGFTRSETEEQSSSSVLAEDLTGQADSCPLIERLQKQSTCI